MKSLKELCVSSGTFDVTRLEAMEKVLVDDHHADMPWYLRLIVGIGAWIASLFFLGCAGMLIGWRDDHRAIFGISGIVLIVCAVLVGRQKWGVFADQCALAVNLAAQAMIYFGFIDEHSHPLATATIFSVIFATVLYVAFPNFLSRLMTCLFASQIILLWIYTSDGEPFSGHLRVESDLSAMVLLYWVVHLAVIGWCFLKTRQPRLFAPLGYAMLVSLAAWQIENLCDVWVRSTVITYSPLWAGWIVFNFRNCLTAVALWMVAVWAAGGIPVLRAKAPLFAGFALVLAALVWIGGGGILLALLFLLLGFALEDRPILGLGLILFPVFLTHYYYILNLDLLAKAGVLIGSGFTLIVLRSFIGRSVFARETL